MDDLDETGRIALDWVREWHEVICQIIRKNPAEAMSQSVQAA
jgi:hypothetical protein